MSGRDWAQAAANCDYVLHIASPIFERVFQTTPARWLTQKRLDTAHFLLTEKKQKPSDIYLELGFEDLSHFSYAFKKRFGYPPSQLPA